MTEAQAVALLTTISAAIENINSELSGLEGEIATLQAAAAAAGSDLPANVGTAIQAVADRTAAIVAAMPPIPPAPAAAAGATTTPTPPAPSPTPTPTP